MRLRSAVVSQGHAAAAAPRRAASAIDSHAAFVFHVYYTVCTVSGLIEIGTGYFPRVKVNYQFIV